MRLLVVTQAVDADSSVLGFFVEWLKELSRQCEEVQVIARAVGRFEAPPNVFIRSMGKESGASRAGRLLRYWGHLRRTLPKVDGVLIHMCPEYLLAGWPLIALSRKPAVLWYAHRRGDRRLKLAMALARRVATVTETSFPFRGPKVAALGHGIPTDLFVPLPEPKLRQRLVAVGRISRIKRLELLIEALSFLIVEGLDPWLDLWGETVMPPDLEYRAELEALVRARGLEKLVTFRGPVPYRRLPELYAEASVALNACPTGALDKAVLEAMSSAVPVVVTNRNFGPAFGADADACLASDDPSDIADKIVAHLRDPDPDLGLRLRAEVERKHSLKRLVGRVLDLYGT
jgi:glycosyltransferase involved in cell wall biosynthesis